MTVSERNPNHPVTQFMSTEWVKIVALLMFMEGSTKVVIPADVVTKFSEERDGHNIAIKFTDDGIELYLVDQQEGERLARREGGLPI